MTPEDRQAALDWTIDLARRVGREVLLPRLQIGKPPAGLRKKGVRDLVTEADELAEEAIVAAIRARWPGHAIVAEEHVRDDIRGVAHRWYVDPLDGTTNFVHGLPLFCTSIACWSEEGPELGVVYNPVIDECFFAARGAGAFLNSRSIRLQVTDTHELIEANLVTGFAYDMERFPNAELWAHFLPRARALRRLGSAAIDLCYVAAGRFDGMWECGLNPHDVAAGGLIVREAGGRVSDYDGGDTWLEGRTLLATNKALHGTLAEEVAAARQAAGHPAL